PLLPDDAQVVVELDLARLRANAVVGPVVTRALARLSGDSHLPGLPFATMGSPLAAADAFVIAAYGVGTASAASVAVLATHGDVPGGVQIAPGLVAIGPDGWIGQLEARAAIAERSPLAAPDELLRLRAHAAPAGRDTAVLRVTARLPFDARVAVARDTGLPTAPARLSVWADVEDDFAVVVDADAADPGDRESKDAALRLATALRGVFRSLADDPLVRALGVPNSLVDARLIAKGTWVRAIVAIGPDHLARAVKRASELLGGAS
ncbi:MAG TPA: hypothetical protein VMJ10_04740, partial [Kofleriaceae bacterium]|nr:hypothetical protein [Kofleriaceae bacterium]